MSEMDLYSQQRKENETGVRLLALSRSSKEAMTLRVAVFNPAGREELEFILLEEYCSELCLEVGALDAEMLPELEYWAEVTEGFFSACASFAYVPSSLRALTQKLIQKGFSRDAAADAVEALRRRGYVKEDEIARRRAELCVGKHWGPTRILAKLGEEGFSDAALKKTREYLATVDFAANCAALIAKKYGDVPRDGSPEARHSRDLIYASLVRMGYTRAQIRSAMCTKT